MPATIHADGLAGNEVGLTEEHTAFAISAFVPPPPLPIDDPLSGIDERYDELDADVLPRSECLRDVVARMLPYWHDAITADLRAGNVVLVAAHGNSLRALVKHLDGMSDADVVELNIPTGMPLVYELDDDLVADGRRSACSA